MNQKIRWAAAAAVLLLLLQGCGTSSAESSTIEVGKKGTVTQTTVSVLDESYYDNSELKSYVKEQIKAYNSSDDAAGKVKLKKYSFSKSDSEVTLILKFPDAQTYADFEQRTFFAGTIEEAQAAGYAFDGDFMTAEEAAEQENTSGDAESDTETAASGDTSGDAGADTDVSGNFADLGLSGTQNVIILEESYNVTVPGDVLYVTAGACGIVSDDTVSADASLAELIYIIYE